MTVIARARSKSVRTHHNCHVYDKTAFDFSTDRTNILASDSTKRCSHLKDTTRIEDTAVKRGGPIIIIQRYNSWSNDGYKVRPVDIRDDPNNEDFVIRASMTDIDVRHFVI